MCEVWRRIFFIYKLSETASIFKAAKYNNELTHACRTYIQYKHGIPDPHLWPESLKIKNLFFWTFRIIEVLCEFVLFGVYIYVYICVY